MGPVNVLADDEYDEHQERHEFLTGQRADVTHSIESLKRTIRDIDKTSSERFVDMLKRMSADTQFLIITHNKLTMQAASTLYGVTMEERGVSKIVGVDVDEMHPEQQLATA